VGAGSRLGWPWICGLPLLPRLIMNSMAYCELCDIDREFCEHGLAERRRATTEVDR
jgi:hypothetical protein